MRLTAEVIDRSAAYTNALKERELDMRSNGIAMIENLELTKDRFDCIDLSNNSIHILENVPHLSRLSRLLLSNNSIRQFQLNLAEKLPNLKMLVLQNNSIADFDQLLPLKSMNRLRHLSLIDCPITKSPNYRLRAIAVLPSTLWSLDFVKITEKERKEALALVEDDLVEHPSKRSRMQMSDTDRERVERALAEATSLEEMQRLERILATGHIPSDFF